MARSGTSWVGRMLCAGGDAGYLEEPFNRANPPGAFRVPVDHWYPYVTEENEDRFLPDLADGLRFKYPLRREIRRCRNAADVRRTFTWWRAFRAARGRRPLVKEPHAVFAARWFADRLGSEVVVTVRHPAAVAASWKRLNWSFDFANLLEQQALVRERLSSFEAPMRRALDPTTDLVDRSALLWKVIYTVVADDLDAHRHFRFVRHEDLSRDPLAGYESLYGQLGLAFTKRAAATVRTSSDAANPKETRVDRPYETKLDTRANVDHWRTRLTREEVARVREITEETAARHYRSLDW